MSAELLAGRYALRAVLASGGMAVVHLAEKVTNGERSRPVAIKRLHPHLVNEGDFVAMFLDEARLTTRLRHPNIVPTLDVVFADSELFLVMDYVEGETLANMRKNARHRNIEFPVGVAAAIIHDALEGLHAAHETTDSQGRALGVVHRDFSPGNLMIGTDGVGRVLDFGVAKAEGRLSSTQAGMLKGKLSYMAPEQLLGGVVDRRADLFSAGLLLWELLTGRRAYYGGDNDTAIIAKVLAADFEAPSIGRPEVSTALDVVVLRAVLADAEERYPTAREMADALASAWPLASRAEVAIFLRQVASEGLARREAAVAALQQPAPLDGSRAPLVSLTGGEVSSSSTLAGLGAQGVSIVPASPRVDRRHDSESPSPIPMDRPRWPWALMVAAPVAALAFFLMRGTPAPSDGGATAAAATVSPSSGAPLASAPLPDSLPVAHAATDESAAPATPSAVLPPPRGTVAPPTTTRHPGVTTGTPGAQKKGKCTGSPYVKSASGILRIRPECI